MDVAADATRDEVVAAYARRAPETTRSCACPDLSTMAEIANPGEDRASRGDGSWRMIAATARYAGHADILREQIDGATDL